MPNVSNEQMVRYKDTLEKARSVGKRAVAKIKAEHKVGQIISTAEAVGAAGVTGFLRGKMEKPDGSWFIPGTPLDWELVAGGSLVAAGMVGTVFGQYSTDSINAGNGILAHYAGQLARKAAKTGSFSLVAGGDTHQGYQDLEDVLSD